MIAMGIAMAVAMAPIVMAGGMKYQKFSDPTQSAYLPCR